MIGNNIKLVIFDLYNTLVVPGRQANSPYERLFKAAELPREEATKLRTVLLTQKFLFDDFVKKFLPQIPQQQVLMIRDYLEKELANTKLFPEVNEVLEKLYTKYDLCLISNASADFKRPFFRLGLDKYFDKVIFSCDVGYTKPNPEIE
jgi:putative hydrolase of the HAD superfamily